MRILPGFEGLYYTNSVVAALHRQSKYEFAGIRDPGSDYYTMSLIQFEHCLPMIDFMFLITGTFTAWDRTGNPRLFWIDLADAFLSIDVSPEQEQQI
jgi:hypothetical protein